MNNTFRRMGLTKLWRGRYNACFGWGLVGAMLLAAVFCRTAGRTEPPPKEQMEEQTKEQKPPPEALEGLGFSYAPREGGKARTSCFGLVGEGYKFVYVFDRSGSMAEHNTLQAVKAEILNSLKPLDSVHQFQIVCYNEQPRVLNLTGTVGRPVFATEENKRRAAEALEGIAPQGGTNHEDAVRLALRLRPDVIFLLSDAGDPPLNHRQLEKLRERAAGVIIHAVEFGVCPQPEGESFLAVLARQTGGKYAYVDISAQKKPSEKPAEVPADN